METLISLVDGEAGRLLWRGHPMAELQDWEFHQLASMLWQEEVKPRDLGQARQRVTPWLKELLPLGTGLTPMEWLRFGLDGLPEASSLDIVAALSMALVLPKNPRAQPDPGLEHLEDIARMLGWSSSQGLRSYCNCVAEHGMNASTYTARVVASTGAGDREAVSAALCALQGPLHGGAPGPVLDMLDELQQCPDPTDWLQQQLLDGRRLMGFGHRIYRVRDPRAEVLWSACRQLPHLAQRLEQARQLETRITQFLERQKPGRRLHANVEYYTAILLEGLGFERQEFTAVFAASRVLGWLAHTREQRQRGRLIRPDSIYLGPLEPERTTELTSR